MNLDEKKCNSRKLEEEHKGRTKEILGKWVRRDNSAGGRKIKAGKKGHIRVRRSKELRGSRKKGINQNKG